MLRVRHQQSRPRVGKAAWRYRFRGQAESLEDRRLLTAVPEMVADVRPGRPGSEISDLVGVGSQLYFRAKDTTDPAGRNYLWKSDGTAAGTVRVALINTSGRYVHPRYFTNVGGTLYFTSFGSGGNELWKSDGTEAGTVRVKDINPGTIGSYPRFLTDVGGTLFFSATGPSGGGIWKSDGTEAGTVLVANYKQPQNPAAADGLPSQLTNVNGTLFFIADDGLKGPDLWKTDGTAAGTVRVKDKWPEGGTTIPVQLAQMGGALFIATDFSNDPQFWTVHLWKSDGSSDGTVLLKDVISDLAPHRLNGVWERSIVTTDNALFFVAGGHRLHNYHLVSPPNLWTTDGTAAGTRNLTMQEEGIGALLLTPVGNSRFFAVNSDGELWRSDGTMAGTLRVKDINIGPAGSSPRDLTDVGGILYFTADDGISGRELWKSDGTEAGTVRVADIRTGQVGSNPLYLTNFNGTLFFSADNGIVNGRELWKLSPDVQPDQAPGDLDRDSDVDSADLLALLSHWTGALEPQVGGKTLSTGDLDGDADVDAADLSAFLARWTGVQTVPPLPPATQPAPNHTDSLPAATRAAVISPLAESLAQLPPPRPALVDQAFQSRRTRGRVIAT